MSPCGKRPSRRLPQGGAPGKHAMPRIPFPNLSIRSYRTFVKATLKNHGRSGRKVAPGLLERSPVRLTVGAFYSVEAQRVGGSIRFPLHAWAGFCWGGRRGAERLNLRAPTSEEAGHPMKRGNPTRRGKHPTRVSFGIPMATYCMPMNSASRSMINSTTIALSSQIITRLVRSCCNS